MVSRSALNAADDLDAVLTGRWVPSPGVRRAAIPFVLVVAAALALLPLALSGEVLVLGIVTVAVLAAGAIGVFWFVMRWTSGSRVIGYSPRGIFVPGRAAPVPWTAFVSVSTGDSGSRVRVISLDLDDAEHVEVIVPSSVTEPEYRAFLAALRSEAEARRAR